MVAYIRHIFFAIGVLLLVSSFAYAYSSPGKASGYVNDFANIFSTEEKASLENILFLFNASSTNEISVVTVKSLGGDYIENYAEKLFKEWGIGTKKYDNGVLLLIAVEDRQMRIEVGYGLEGSLTDSVASQIIRDHLTPAFKQGDFYGGVTLAVNHIIKVTRGEYKNDNPSSSSNKGFDYEFLIVAIVIVFQFLGSILGRSKSWWAGGVIGGAAGIGLTFFQVLGITFVVGVVITIVLALLGLLFDYLVSGKYTEAIRSGTVPPWWAGGAGRSGGGSSFGGFSGGSSGGGGSSGSW